MQLNKNYEIELSLKDLLFHVLYKWRFILLVGFIAAGFFGFMEYWGFEKYHRAGELTPGESQYEVNQEAIARVEKDIAAYDELIQDKTNYRDTSVLMKMDPTSIWTAEKKYRFSQDGSPVDHAGSTMTALTEAFSRDFAEETLMEAFGTAARNDIDEVASITVNRGLWTISVVGCGSTEEEAVKRKEFVDSCLHETEAKLHETLIFTLEPLSDNVGTKTFLTTGNMNRDKVEKDLAAIQNSVSENIRAYQAQQREYLNTRDSLKAQYGEKPTPKIAKQAIFGFALGAFLMIAFFATIYLFNGKIKTSREMENRYDLLLLGEVDHSRAWRKGKGLDWLIERLEFGKKKVPENELDSIASLIDPGRDGKTILLTGSLEEKEIGSVCAALSAKLQEKGMTLTVQPSFLHNSKAVATAAASDTVILVEEQYKSKVKDLNRMAVMLKIENAKVIGAVLI